ncbi:MAG: cysteine--tRNA ligase [Candidatus Asgardarchaeum sp.]
MSIKIYNYLTKTKEEFKPLNSPLVKMYVCGPTVYDHSHVGHARTYIAFDVIRRYLEYRGYRVKYVMNITDIDDKIIKKANALNVSYAEVSTKYLLSFFEDLHSLNIKPADVHPLATAHIPDMIELIERLIKKGLAYVADGDVYYDVRKFKEYGKLSKQSIEDMKAGARIEPTEKKRFPLDFALWKAAKPGEPFWPSPWGYGRPGWHIECSAMVMRHLGEQIDIHGGGLDLIFPHHENEIAQSEGATGKQFAKYWMYTGLLTIRGDKMSKSLGNIITIKEALKKWDPGALRLFVLTTHYRSPIDFSEESLESATASLKRLYTVRQNLRIAIEEADERKELNDAEKKFMEIIRKSKDEFIKHMDDDFNTPQALATLFTFVRLLNLYLDKLKARSVIEKADSFLEEVIDVFGIPKEEEGISVDFKKLLELIINVRSELRRNKMYELSDLIREKLRELGIELQDTKKGTRYYIL